MARPDKVIFESVRGFIKDRGVIYSAALSYFFILDIVPLCLFAVGLAGFVIGSDEELFRFILDRLMWVFPDATSAVTSELERLIQFRGVAITSLALYAFLSFQLYGGVQKALSAMFRIEGRRSFVDIVLKPLAVVSLVFMLMLLSFMLTTLVPVIERYDFIIVDMSMVSSFFLRYILPLGIVQFTALIVYVLVPQMNVRVDDAFWGGLFTAVMLEAAKHLFTWYVGSVSRLGTMYGSLAVFVTFLLWLYYSWAIFLIGAQMVRVCGERAQATGPLVE